MNSRAAAPPLIVETEGLTPASHAWISERARVLSVSKDDPDALADALAYARALVVRTYTVVDDALLALAPHLEVVGRAGVGLDNIDLAACRERGVAVVHTPEANAGAVTELLFALLLDVLRPRHRLLLAPSPEEWHGFRRDLLGRRELSELTLGIWGLGRVGKRVAAAAAGFRMPVLYHDLLEIPDAFRHGAKPTSRDDLIARADILTLHVDGRSTNRHLVDAAILARRPKGSLLANLSRGFVVDPKALAKHLDQDPEAWAICDVHDPEPPTADHPLLSRPNAWLVPHLGAGTRSAKERMSRVVEDVWGVLSGSPPRHPAP